MKTFHSALASFCTAHAPTVEHEVENHSQVIAGSALAGFWSGIYLALVEERRRKLVISSTPKREM
jgi:hypothetical protein